MRTKKALLAALCAVLLVVGSVVGTMAYLTDTETVINTFTVGSVTFGDGANEKGLDEALVNEYGDPINNDDEKTVVDLINAPRVQGNDYKLVPGHTYVKDPTIHIKNDSENCYLYVKVENGISAIEAETAGEYKCVADQLADNDWVALPDVDNVYYQSWSPANDLAAGDVTDDVVVFEEFAVAGAVDNATIEQNASETIVVTAYAVQADGFDSAAEAWAATFGAPSAQG